MTSPPASGAPADTVAGSPGPSAPVPVPVRATVIVAALAVTQTVGYGALYYCFPVLLVPMARDLGASTAAVTGALTASILAGAATAVPVGRWLDAHGGRALMTLGSLAGTALVLLAAAVPNLPALYAVWTAIGAVSGAVLYEAAFAVVVPWFPDARRRASALLAVTVVAGFSSTIFFPLTGHLVEAHGWRTALVVLAVLHGVVTVPLHLLVRRPPEPVEPHGPPAGPRRADAVRAAVRDRRFWILTAAFTAETVAVAVVGVHVVAYLAELGHPPALAATVAGALGVLQVAGRLVLTAAQRRWPTHLVVAAIFVLQAAAVLALPVAGRDVAGAVLCVALFGLGFGVGTIARPALLADRYGTTGFGAVAGVMTVPLTVTKAIAPLGAAALHGLTGSYTAVAVTVAVACGAAAVLVAAPGQAVVAGVLRQAGTSKGSA